MADFDQIPEQALDWFNAGKGTVLATVVQTWGSAPRPTGSQLAINENMEMAGSVSGGCVEGAIVEEAINALKDGVPRLLEYGVSDEEAFAVGLACGGAIHVLIEPIGIGQGPDAALLKALVEYRADRRAAAYLVNTKTWERQVIGSDFNAIDLASRFTSDKSGFEGDWFVNIHNPPLRMIVVGAVHIAQPLMQLARVAGYDAVLVDPREAFATVARFPGERLLHVWPDDALEAEGLDARVAVVTLTHDPKLDDPAIKVAIASDVFYLGCLGSTRTHAKRVARLKEAGLTDTQITKIHAPVGADIGSKTPAEIAISIMAEITERLRRPETRR
ncbi:XdhC/CoxI family protein [Rhodobacterales bacterium 52_120_T64]|nr:XdhC/CoxI family protein [Rhodobacterales bacterium 52_120_T64]